MTTSLFSAMDDDRDKKDKDKKKKKKKESKKDKGKEKAKPFHQLQWFQLWQVVYFAFFWRVIIFFQVSQGTYIELSYIIRISNCTY